LIAPMATHVTNEELAGYIYQPSSNNFSFVEKHINTCSKCRNTYTQMLALVTQLKSSRESELDQVHEPHLTDETIIAYVHEQLDPTATNKIEAHLNDCGECMKAVLRYRAYLAEFESQQNSNDSNDKAIRFQQIPVKNRHISRFALPLAAAAAMVISVLAIIQWQIGKTPEQVASSQLTPPDIVQPGTQNQGLSPSSIIPASTGENKTISWYDGFIETTAIGTADMSKMKNKVQAEIVAEKTARHLAYSQLAEILKGVQVTSTTTYEDLLLKVDDLNVHSEGFIRGAQVIDREISWVDDAPKAMVTVRAPLFGQNSLKNIIQVNTDTTLIEMPQHMLVSNVALKDQASQYSNIIIDATGVEFSPALFTSLVSTSNQSVIDKTKAITMEYMYYAKLENAKASNFAGRAPVVVKANPNSKPGTLVLSEADAQLTHAILNQHHLNNNKPMLVVF
jgi:anti-sigma factor RsiW